MRRPFVIPAVVAVVLLLGVGYSGVPRLLLYRPHATLTLDPLPAPAVTRTGRLTWLGGARLSGSDAAFGGFSALAVEGRRITLLSDGGNLLAFTLTPGWQAGEATFGELPAGPRSGWEKRDRDSESLAVAPDGRAWVGFESVNQLWRYAPGFAAATGQAAPRPMARWDGNGGAETLVRLRDGRFLTISETTRRKGKQGRAALLFAGDPVTSPARGFVYRPAPGFDPVDAAQLPNGDLLVLERRWLLPVRFRSRIALVKLSALVPGAVVSGIEVGRIAPPFPTENYEGIAVTRDGPATIVWLASDDDQTWWRRSYLLQFRLD